MSVRVMDTRQIGELTFPSSEELQVWKSKDDAIVLPAEALLENSDGGLVRVVLFSYDHMEDILSPFQEASRRSAGASVSSPVPASSTFQPLQSPRRRSNAQALRFSFCFVQQIGNRPCTRPRRRLRRRRRRRRPAAPAAPT